MATRWLLLAPLAVLLVWAAPTRDARAQDDSAASGEEAPAPKKKKKKPAKKAFDYEKSKYKSVAEPTGTYRFNDKGDPIVKETKKKTVKKKKRSEPPEAEAKEGSSESCGLEAGCGGNKSEADAL